MLQIVKYVEKWESYRVMRDILMVMQHEYSFCILNMVTNKHRFHTWTRLNKNQILEIEKGDKSVMSFTLYTTGMVTFYKDLDISIGNPISYVNRQGDKATLK